MQKIYKLALLSHTLSELKGSKNLCTCYIKYFVNFVSF
nr:MAG TPA: hypothetical protein [Caudoviricetes sp.]